MKPTTRPETATTVLWRRMAGRYHPPGQPKWAWQTLPVAFSWSTRDPLAVTLLLGDVAWVVARDLLVEGLDRSAGLGDVLVFPEPAAVTSRRSTRTRLRIRGDDLEATVSVVTRSLARALNATTQVVPLGTEEVPGFDADLDALLTERP